MTNLRIEDYKYHLLLDNYHTCSINIYCISDLSAEIDKD